MGIAIIVAVSLVVAAAIVAAAFWPRPGVRTLADPPAAGETGGHRGEIAAPDAGVTRRPSLTSGLRFSGPNGTVSGERWSPDTPDMGDQPAPQPPSQPVATQVAEPAVAAETIAELRNGQAEVVSALHDLAQALADRQTEVPESPTGEEGAGATVAETMAAAPAPATE